MGMDKPIGSQAHILAMEANVHRPLASTWTSALILSMLVSLIDVQLSAELHGSFWSEVDGRSDALKPVDVAHTN